MFLLRLFLSPSFKHLLKFKRRRHVLVTAGKLQLSRRTLKIPQIYSRGSVAASQRPFYYRRVSTCDISNFLLSAARFEGSPRWIRHTNPLRVLHDISLPSLLSDLPPISCSSWSLSTKGLTSSALVISATVSKPNPTAGVTLAVTNHP